MSLKITANQVGLDEGNGMPKRRLPCNIPIGQIIMERENITRAEVNDWDGN